jgi:hypothetical protein
MQRSSPQTRSGGFSVTTALFGCLLNPHKAAALADDWAKRLGLSGAKKIEGVFYNKTTTLMVSNVHSWTP